MKKPRRGRAFCASSPELLGTDDFHFDATIRLQAGDLRGAATDVVALVAGDRLGFALAFGVDAVRIDALRDQVGLDGGGATLGQTLVVGGGTEAVGVADGEDHFQLERLGLGSQFVQLGLAFRLQDGLVEVEQGVGSQLDLVGGGLRSGSGSSDRGGALVGRNDVGIAGAANREVAGHSGGGGSRAPVASAPAQASTAAGDDVTGVDHVRDFTLASNDDVVDLRESAGCGQADR